MAAKDSKVPQKAPADTKASETKVSQEQIAKILCTYAPLLLAEGNWIAIIDIDNQEISQLACRICRTTELGGDMRTMFGDYDPKTRVPTIVGRMHNPTRPALSLSQLPWANPQGKCTVCGLAPESHGKGGEDAVKFLSSRLALPIEAACRRTVPWHKIIEIRPTAPISPLTARKVMSAIAVIAFNQHTWIKEMITQQMTSMLMQNAAAGGIDMEDIDSQIISKETPSDTPNPPTINLTQGEDSTGTIVSVVNEIADAITSLENGDDITWSPSGKLIDLICELDDVEREEEKFSDAKTDEATIAANKRKLRATLTKGIATLKYGTQSFFIEYGSLIHKLCVRTGTESYPEMIKEIRDKLNTGTSTHVCSGGKTSNGMDN